jgi:hypothetical protein
LYSPIEEEVYVQPPTDIVLEWSGKIMRLKKVVYGTCHAVQCWWKFFSKKFVIFGFTTSELEPSLYYCKQGNEFIVIWLQIDDGFVMGSSKRFLDELHHAISCEMEFKWSDTVKKTGGH